MKNAFFLDEELINILYGNIIKLYIAQAAEYADYRGVLRPVFEHHL